MRHSEQVAMIKRLLALRETRRDEKMLDEVVTIPVTKYTDEALLEREIASAFSHYPLVAGHASALGAPGPTSPATGTGSPMSSSGARTAGSAPSTTSAATAVPASPASRRAR